VTQNIPNQLSHTKTSSYKNCINPLCNYYNIIPQYTGNKFDIQYLINYVVSKVTA